MYGAAVRGTQKDYTIGYSGRRWRLVGTNNRKRKAPADAQIAAWSWVEEECAYNATFPSLVHVSLVSAADAVLQTEFDDPLF